MYLTLKYIYLFVLLLLTVLTLFSFKRIRQADATWLGAAILLSFTVEALGLSFELIRIPGNWLYNLYGIFIFPMYVLYLGRHTSPAARRASLGVAAVFVAGALGNLFLGQGMVRFNQYTLLAGAALVIVFSLWYFKSRFDRPYEKLSRSAVFWVATGLLLYFTGTLFYFGFLKYLHQLGGNWVKQVNVLLQGLNIVFYSMLAVAVVCLRRRQM